MRIGIQGSLAGRPERERPDRRAARRRRQPEPVARLRPRRQLKLKDELAEGCAPSYTRNTGTTCPARPPRCGPLRSPGPASAIQTGSATNQVPAGLNKRILGDEKPTPAPRRTTGARFPDLPPGDPRIVQVFLTPYGSFSGSGKHDGAGDQLRDLLRDRLDRRATASPTPARATATTRCRTTTPATSSATSSSTSQTLNNGGGGSEPCDFNAFGPASPY